MKLSLKPQYLKRYKEIAILFLKYAHSDVAKQFGFHETLDEREIPPRVEGKPDPPEQLARDLEKMGPTFVKVGQLLSSRIDLLPQPYTRALSRLQDDVEPFPYSEVDRIITHDLGLRISKAFSRFEQAPLAAASLGQVHRAALRDGREVVVKVQRPGIRPLIMEDLEALGAILEFLDVHSEMARRYQFLKIFEEFQQTLLRELDYHREAANLLAFRHNLADFERIRIPAPIEDYTTATILTMEYIPGTKVTAITPLARMDIEGAALAEELFRAYLKQVLIDGLFHADPHPGNIYITPEGQVALLDVGMVGRTTPSMQRHLLKLLLAISEGQSDEAAEVAMKISETTERFDEGNFRRMIATVILENQDQSLRKFDVGKALLELGRSASDTGLYVPTDLTLLGKTILQLEEIGRVLDPHFNPALSIRQNVGAILNHRFRRSASPGKVLNSILEMKDFMGRLPGRVSKILDAVADAELEVRVKASDVNEILEGFQKIANRIAAGLILAALIVGASLLMQVHTEFTIFGYPGLAILCFLAAAGGGTWLLFHIFITDQKKKPRK